MTITFYRSSAEQNRVDKTPQLSSQTLVLTGDPVGPVSVTELTVRCRITGTPTWNYAYITDFARWYFVTEWTCGTDGIWDVSLTGDPLMSFRSKFLPLSAYVLRQENEANTSLTDTLPPIPCYSDVHETAGLAAQNAWSDYSSAWTGTEARIVVKLVTSSIVMSGGSTTSSYGATYLLLTPAAFRRIMDSVSQVAVGANIADYVLAAYWIPVQPTVHTGYVSTITVGGSILTQTTIAFAANTAYLMEGNTVITSKWSVPVYTRSASRYLNSPPYRSYSLRFMPFGSVRVDASLINANNFYAWTKIDVLTGAGDLYMTTGSTFDAPIHLASAQVGVGLDVSGTRPITMQTVASTIGGLTAAAGMAYSGNLIGAVAAGASTLAAFANSGGHPSVAGSQGSGLIDTQPHLITYQTTPGALPAGLYGLPCCKTLQLSTLTGFTKVGAIHLEGLDDATASEISQIEASLMDGVIL